MENEALEHCWKGKKNIVMRGKKKRPSSRMKEGRQISPII